MLYLRLLRGFTGGAFVTALLLANPAAAQSHRVQAPKAARPAKAVVSTVPAALGTFQLVQRSQKQTISLTTEALVEIERRRQSTAEARWELNQFAYVRILSRSAILAPGFQPLEPIVSQER